MAVTVTRTASPRKQTSVVTAILRWSAPLIVPAGNEWVPTVELVNLGDEPVEVRGGQMAQGRLLHPDETPVTSRQEQPYPMPAILRVLQLKPGEDRYLPTGLSLTADERAALPPGNYRLVDVAWGELTAPDIELRVAD